MVDNELPTYAIRNNGERLHGFDWSMRRTNPAKALLSVQRFLLDKSSYGYSVEIAVLRPQLNIHRNENGQNKNHVYRDTHSGRQAAL